MKRPFLSVSLAFKYAPGPSLLHLVQCAAAAALAPVSIFAAQQVIDMLANFIGDSGNLSGLPFWGFIWILALFLADVNSGFINWIIIASVRRSFLKGVSLDITKKFLRLSYRYFEDPAAQDLLQRMSKSPEEKLFLLFRSVAAFLQISISIAGTAVILSQAGIVFSAGFIVLFIPIAWFSYKATDMMRTMMAGQSSEERRMNYFGTLLSGKASLFELKIFRAVPYIAGKWRRSAKQVLDERIRTTVRSEMFYLASTVILKIWTILIIAWLVVSVIRGSVSLGFFMAVITASSGIFDSVWNAAHTYQMIRSNSLAVESFLEFLGLEETFPEGRAADVPDTADTAESEQRGIVFRDVHFAYPGTEVLRGLSFEIKPGERAAIVGENGAGKSTIIKLLLGLYRPGSGGIFIDGRNIDSISDKEISAEFAVVFQDYGSYQLTLRENVALGDISKLNDDESITGALELAGADTIAALDAPLGKIEDNGIDLSGGQWQRIALARSYLRNAPYIILDEPTASLDPIAESRMYENFAGRMRNRGCIMISHRLASAKMADKILVLDKGVIVETGSHAELIGAGGLYAAMYHAQSAWYHDAEDSEGSPG
jgi:ABC-type multidrug transport system fused ATPase/permease subunit